METLKGLKRTHYCGDLRMDNVGKKTGKGGFKHKHANLRHILTKKATKRKRHLRPKAMVSKGDLGLVIACLPYA